VDIQQALSKSIQTGFVDRLVQSSLAYRPEFLVNDPDHGKKVLSSILRELDGCDEFWFSVAFITTSGVATLMNMLIELEQRGVNGKILASQYLNFTQPEALKRIKQFNNIDLRIVTDGDFHSKGYLFKKNGVWDLIIGSSNLTQTALSTNVEWNLKVSAAYDSELIDHATNEFEKEFRSATKVTDEYIKNYRSIWESNNDLIKEIKQRQALGNKKQKTENLSNLSGDALADYEVSNTVYLDSVKPNRMQVEALNSIEELRNQGKDKALLISATGTGKTYLSAFDVQKMKPKRFLFVVHRLTIAEEAMKTFQDLLGSDISMGVYSGQQQALDADYVFSTVQTISKPDHLEKFERKHFDYIVIDETHRAGAKSYENIMTHFEPKFLLGMTATPERTDGADIFKLFDYNIAYEIRLHRALAEGMLSPFHYYGVTDLTVEDQEIDELSDFNFLTASERVERIIETADRYGCDDGEVRGLVFCSRNEVSQQLSREFNVRNRKTIALTGDSSEEQRKEAIRRLESDDPDRKLDYIFTVDIFNEGIDIPRVNQIIMLRPTQSAIIFVQQLGRGLRKIDDKEYLTVIDFIGNYSNNYLVPIALYGDTSYNKDSLRKLMASGSSLIPGASTINFDKIANDRIFAAIDSAKMQNLKGLKEDYQLLKFKLGRVPMMVDFIDHGGRDPQLYVKHSKSYYNFVTRIEDEYKDTLDSQLRKLLELFSSEINNAKRIEETLILDGLIEFGSVDIGHIAHEVQQKYGHGVSEATIQSCVRNLNFEFITEKKDGKLSPVREIYDLNIVRQHGAELQIEEAFEQLLLNVTFKAFLLDTIGCAKKIYDQKFSSENYFEGFNLYQKYTRKDVFRILNWAQNPVAQNVGGYQIGEGDKDCAIFVTYHKEEDISSTTKYEDGFIDPATFAWMSKSRRTLKSNDVRTIKNYRSGLRLPLFIKKSNDEEKKEFYYMGDMQPIDDINPALNIRNML